MNIGDPIAARNRVIHGKDRRLGDLCSIGPATLQDFDLLGIRTVTQLARRDANQMYRALCRLKGERQDICCLDVFYAAVAQARDPALPTEQRNWWYWSRKRKAADARHPNPLRKIRK